MASHQSGKGRDLSLPFLHQSKHRKRDFISSFTSVKDIGFDGRLGRRCCVSPIQTAMTTRLRNFQFYTVKKKKKAIRKDIHVQPFHAIPFLKDSLSELVKIFSNL